MTGPHPDSAAGPCCPTAESKCRLQDVPCTWTCTSLWNSRHPWPFPPAMGVFTLPSPSPGQKRHPAPGEEPCALILAAPSFTPPTYLQPGYFRSDNLTRTDARRGFHYLTIVLLGGIGRSVEISEVMPPGGPVNSATPRNLPENLRAKRPASLPAPTCRPGFPFRFAPSTSRPSDARIPVRCGSSANRSRWRRRVLHGRYTESPGSTEQWHYPHGRSTTRKPTNSRFCRVTCDPWYLSSSRTMKSLRRTGNRHWTIAVRS